MYFGAVPILTRGPSAKFLGGPAVFDSLDYRSIALLQQRTLQ